MSLPTEVPPATVVVQKYGGSSLADADALRSVARRVADERGRGSAVVVVVSAMGDTTNRLLDSARLVSPDPPRRELDALLGTGERSSAALLAMALHEVGLPAVSLDGRQCGIETNPVHLNARIVAVRPQRVRRELDAGRVVVATGYQGVGPDGELTTLGRGGSDTSAVALAAALEAERCEIYTDVDGVFSADPRVVPRAELLDSMGSDEMQELAWHGAQVLKAEAVELAAGNDVTLSVRSSRGDGPGTRVLARAAGGTGIDAGAFRPRRPPVAGVVGRRDLMGVTFYSSSDGDHGAFHALLATLAPYDLVSASLQGSSGRVYLSTLEIPDAEQLRSALESGWPDRVVVRCGLGAVSMVGFGLGSRPGSLLAAKEVLEGQGMSVLDTFTGRESVSLVVDAGRVEEGVAGLHRHYVEHPSAERGAALADQGVTP